MYGGNRSSGALRILVVRLGAMGDILHALPAASSLKYAHPDTHLTWAVEPRWQALLAGNPMIDRLVLLRRRSAAALLASWHDLRAAEYDSAVDFQGLLKSALTAAAARPGRIFGFDASQVRERAAALFYSNRIRAASTHVVERNLDLAEAAGATRRLALFPLPPGEPEGQLPPGDFVLASPLAGWRSKQWPLEHYRQLAALLRRELDLPLVLNGPVAAAAEFASAAGALPHFSGIEGLIYATRRAVAVVGVDSGPLHLAAALGKPGVAIFGPTDPARNGPRGGAVTVLRNPAAQTTYKRNNEIDPSMIAIAPDQVFAALRHAIHHSAVNRGSRP